jgi:tetratricopeptide (TPR) repeat protein
MRPPNSCSQIPFNLVSPLAGSRTLLSGLFTAARWFAMPQARRESWHGRTRSGAQRCFFCAVSREQRCFVRGVHSFALAAIAGVVLAAAALGTEARIEAQTDGGLISQIARERMHDTMQWGAIEQHLPNRLTSTPEVLEQEGDILRARRFPEDAMDYYNFAFQNGGDAATLLDKLGLIALEMRDVPWARAYFRRVVQIDRKNADGWDNLGTVEYLSGRPAFAVADYERAVKLDKSRPDFHCNLAAAYLAEDNYQSARKEMAAALRLDPEAFEHVSDGSSTATQVFSSEERGRLSLELAKLHARSGAEEPMFHSLAMASEAGVDLRHQMRRDGVLAHYANDPRVLVLEHNARALRGFGGDGAGAAPPVASIQPLDEEWVLSD